MGQAAVSGVSVTARFRAGPGQADALIPLLARLAEHSRGEDGCLDYGYFRQGDEFTSIEHWADAESEAAHNDSAFLREILPQILPLLDGRSAVMRWRRIA